MNPTTIERLQTALQNSSLLTDWERGFVESLLQLVGLNWTVPGFSTLSRRQKTLAVTT